MVTNQHFQLRILIRKNITEELFWFLWIAGISNTDCFW